MYQKTLEKTTSLTANAQFDDFLSESQLVKQHRRMPKKRIIFSGSKHAKSGAKIAEKGLETLKYQPYEDTAHVIPRRRLNTGLMLTTLKQNMNLYG
jgi:hypothetical protein